MNETLIVSKFGPIDSVELTLRRFNILIGENAVGKSTIAKLFSICRYFSYIVDTTLGAIIPEHPFLEGLKAWGLEGFLSKDTHIFYECRHYSIRINGILSREEDEEYGPREWLDVEADLQPKSDEFKNLLEELKSIMPNEQHTYYSWRPPTSFFQNDVSSVMDNPFFIPTERGLQSLFSLGKNSVQNISDNLFNQFAQLDQIFKTYNKETDIEPLQITYINSAGNGFIKEKASNSSFPVADVASGYKSTIPIVLLVKYYVDIRKKSKTFIIEEPELNLFPSNQQKLIQFLVGKVISSSSNILLTTHSPYILTTLNNMLYAHQVSKIDELKTENLLERKYWLNPEDVSTYILKDGKCEDILDRSEGLIISERIDEVSNAINQLFDNLSTIEFDKE